MITPHRRPHQVVRYGPALRLLRAQPPGTTVLEVGSGSMGIGSWYDGPYIGLDIEYDRRPPERMLPVIADGTRLPFADRSIDVVVCAGVLTHAIGGYEPVVDEIARVARRHAVVVSPVGAAAEATDRRLLAFCARYRLRTPAWLVEQAERGLPAEEVVREILSRHGRVEVGTTMSVRWQERFFKTERWMLLLRGSMTAVQPALRRWGARGARDFAAGTPYERWFRVDIGATDSPPRAAS